MSWNETLLQKLADWRPEGPGRHALASTDDAAAWTATIEVNRNDQLGCLLWEASLRRSSPLGGTLQAWADRIAARVTSLIEPLAVIEVDATRNEALLRSEQPSRRGQGLLYFELRLKGTHEARLCRFQASQEEPKPRVQVSAPLTHEALVKFISDVVSPAE